MKNIRNVTNNMTSTNSYLSSGLIQGEGNGTIKTKEGRKVKQLIGYLLIWVKLVVKVHFFMK